MTCPCDCHMDGPSPCCEECRDESAMTADCFLHGFYELGENGVGACPVCEGEK